MIIVQNLYMTMHKKAQHDNAKRGSTKTASNLLAVCERFKLACDHPQSKRLDVGAPPRSKTSSSKINIGLNNIFQSASDSSWLVIILKQCAWMSERHHAPKPHGFMGTHRLADSDHRRLLVLTVRKTGAAAGPIFTTHVYTGVLTTSGVVCLQPGLALSP